MSSELLGSAQNVLKGNLGGAWDITNGYQDAYTDLGIARRFGGASAAYSLRDIGAMNGPVVRVRRNNDSTEEDFSANQVQAGVLEDFCDNVLTVGTAVNGTSPYNNYTFTANGNTGFDADNSGGGIGSAGFPYVFKNGDIMTVTYTVTNFSSTSGLSPQIRGTNGTGSVTSTASGGTTFTANGTYTDTLTATADGNHLMFADGNTGSYTISNFAVTSHKTDGFVETWYDQSGNGRDITQGTAGNQPAIVRNGGQVKSENLLPSVSFADNDVTLEREEFLSGQLSAYFLVYDAEAGDSGVAQVVFRQGNNYRLSSAVQTNGKVRGQIRDGGGDALNLDSGGDLATGGTILQSTFIRARGADGFINYAQGANEVKGDSTDIEDTDFAAADTGDFALGANPGGAFDFKGEIQEAIFFESDLFTDKSTIETELNNHYNAF